MKETLVLSKKILMPLKINAHEVKWLVIGGGANAFETIGLLLSYSNKFPITVIASIRTRVAL